MAEAFYVLKVCNYESAAEKHLTMKACSVNSVTVSGE